METPKRTQQKRRIVVGCILLSMLVLAGLGLYTQFSAMSYTTLVERLRAAGAAVTSNGTVQQPFFSVPGHILSVNGEDVQVFEYALTLLAALDARQVAPDGEAVGRAVHISWIAPPHFYARGRLIVIYLGDNAAQMKLMESVLGPQFAGANCPGMWSPVYGCVTTG